MVTFTLDLWGGECYYWGYNIHGGKGNVTIFQPYSIKKQNMFWYLLTALVCYTSYSTGLNSDCSVYVSED